MIGRGLTVVLSLCSALAGVPAAASETVDLRLVLAVDASSSVNFSEFSLQMNGLAAAFRDPGVIAAALGGRHNAIAVTVLMWASPGEAKVAIGWTRIASAEEADALATAIDVTPRVVRGGGTGIAAMLDRAAGLFADTAFQAPRQVIDVAGDGRDTHDQQTGKTRDRLIAQGIVINGLPFLNEEPDLEAYYLAAVTGGAGSFAIPVADYSDFATAMRAKLIREISGDLVVGSRARTIPIL